MAFIEHTIEDRELDGILRAVNRMEADPALAQTRQMSSKKNVVTFMQPNGKRVRLTVSALTYPLTRAMVLTLEFER